MIEFVCRTKRNPVANPIFEAAASAVQSAALPGERVPQAQVHSHPTLLWLRAQGKILVRELCARLLPHPANRKVVTHKVGFLQRVQPHCQVLRAQTSGRHVPLSQLHKASTSHRQAQQQPSLEPLEPKTEVRR